MSINNIYPELEDKVYVRYAKVPIHIVGGTRLDPHDLRSTIPWVLKTEPEDFDAKTKSLTFQYESEVIELYSKRELDTFLRLNANLIKKGLLKEYAGTKDTVSLSNSVSDEELQEVVALRSNQDFMDALSKFDSRQTLLRIKEIATEAGKSVKRIQLIDARIEELHGDS
jgi:hypothetical protein